MSRNIKRNIIIGADAKQFTDAIKGVQEETQRVSEEMQSVGTSIFTSVAAAHVLKEGIRAVVAFFQNAVSAAMELPEGLSKAVDEARKLNEESQKLNELLGVQLIESGMNVNKVFEQMKLTLSGALSETTDWVDILALLSFSPKAFANLQKAGRVELEQFNTRKSNLEDQQKRWEAVQKRMEEVTKEQEKQLKLQEKQAQAMAEYLGLVARNKILIADMVAEMQNGIFASEAINTEMAVLSPILNAIKDDMREIFDPMDIEDFEGNLQRINDELRNTQQTAAWLGSELFMAFNMATRGGEDFFTNMANYLKDFIKQMLIAAGVAAVLSAVFGAGIGSFGSIFKGLIGLPKMAHGGIVNGPTPLIAGENGPEAILPLNAMAGMGGNLVTKISGKDLLIMLDRESNFRARAYA